MLADHKRLAEHLRSHGRSDVIGIEATGNYHRPLVYFLHQQGVRVMPDSNAGFVSYARSGARSNSGGSHVIANAYI